MVSVLYWGLASAGSLFLLDKWDKVGYNTGMKTLTKVNRKSLPAIGTQENSSDPIVYVKFFTPWDGWTWYASEFDGKDLFFGKVVSPLCPDGELGYFSLSELESVKGPFGLCIERDIHFEPMELSLTSKGF